MGVSDARRLKVYEQARAHWGEETAEVLMELVVALSARMDGIDALMDGLATKEYVLRTLMLVLLPVYVGMLGILGSIIGLYCTG